MFAFCRVLHLVLLCLIALVGCQRAASDSKTPAGAGGTTVAPTAADLKVLVVDDGPLAESLRRWRQEWQALAGASYEVVEIAGTALPTDWSIQHDVILYPAVMLGTWAEQAAIRPLRTTLLESEQYQVSDLFPLLWESEVRWGGEPYALSLGTPVLTLAYRADLLAAERRAPPTNWTEYQELVKHFSKRPEAARPNTGDDKPAEKIAAESWQAACEPLAPGSAGNVLLARAAAYARHRNLLSTLFDRTTMEPLIASAAFERALQELVAAAGPRSEQAAPLDAMADLLAGRCALALTWTSATQGKNKAQEDVPSSFAEQITFVELPGSPEMYNLAAKKWDQRTGEISSRVTTLGVSGRLGSVTSGSHSVPTAMRFLAWLTRANDSDRVCAASASTTLFRKSQVMQPGDWVDASLPVAAARQYATVVEASLSRIDFLLAPRLPGAARYQAALDQAVHSAVAGELSPAAALAVAASQWKTITRELGIEKQRAAYLRSLGEVVPH